METVTIKKQVITVRGQAVVIYCYELLVELLKEWKKQGMSQEDIEDLLLS